MKLRANFLKILLAGLITFLCIGNEAIGQQIPTSCAKIESILVAACGQPEGQNEMLRFQIGPNPMNTANLSITWATTTIPWSGLIQNAATARKVDSINAQITSCGYVREPVNGVLPAGAQVIIVTSYAMVTSFNSFANLQDTIYMLFHNSTNTTGHFKNYGCAGCYRTTVLTFSGAGGCTDSVTYEPDSLRTPAGTYGSAGGGSVLFNFDGTKLYYNDGCQIPLRPATINAGNDSTYQFCRTFPVISLHGSYTGSIKSYHWQGGFGTFTHPDSLTTTYTPSLLDLSPIRFIITGRLACNDSIKDTVYAFIAPPPVNAQNKTICAGGSYHIGVHTYTSAGVYLDTLLTTGGCDSIEVTTLSIITAANQSINLSGCGSVIYKGITHSTNTTVLDTLRGSLGCDSINLTVNITIKQNSTFSQAVSICQGQSITVGTHSHSIPGTYTDTLTNAIGCDSIVTTTLSYAGTPISAGSNTSICQGSPTQLQATGGSIYTWTPSIGLSDTTIANPIANPTTTTTYTVSTLVPVGNQITNGDFSSGNSGFSSGYTYTNVAPGIPCGTYGILGCEGYYNVNSNPANTHSNFASFGDHTTGSGQMMIVNGSTSPSVNVWCQTINVTPNTTYQFSAWVANVDNAPSSLPNLQFTINGTPLGNYFSPSITGGIWSQFAVSWFSGSNTSVNICLTDSSTVSGGNDFAIDDIAFSSVCHATDTVQVVVKPSSYHVQSPTICPRQTLAVGNHTYSSTGTYQDTISGGAVSGCDSIITTHLTILSTARSSKSACINTGQSYMAGGHLQTASGIYSDTLVSSNGCDSIITTNLNVITPIHLTKHIYSCSRVTFNGNTYTSNTIISDTVKSPLGCDSLITTDSIIVYQPVNISISSSQTLPLVEGDSTLLTIIPTGTYQNIVWTPDFNISNISTPSTQVWPQRDTTYTVVATDSNNCPISGSIEITIKPNGKADFVMPTAFSPNGDGKNDLYRPILRPGSEVLMFHIYNRWGELVYDKDRDNSQGWDGSYKNAGQPNEVYVYYISVRGVAGNIIKQQGSLTLLR